MFDNFHPLCVPSTVYTFSTGALDAVGTVSASDDERLPPGSFSLRYAFPNWFGRGGSLRSSSGNDSTLDSAEDGSDDVERHLNIKLGAASDSRSTTLKVLKHLKEAFEDEEFLDSIPVGAAGNPSAWHAWRAHRGLAHRQHRGRSLDNTENDKSQMFPRQPGDWNWEGVWESRVHESIEMSSNEVTLFINPGRIRFSKLDDVQYNEIKGEMLSRV